LRPGAALTLDDYRGSYKVNREYQALQDLLRTTSIYAIWDDHEVYNDYAGQDVDPARYAAGRQAFQEYHPLMDLDLPVDPSCAGDPFLRVFRWGPDVDMIILDERSCRSAAAIEACLISLPIVGDIPDPLPTAPASIRTSFSLPIIGSLPPAPPDGCLEAISASDRTFLGPVQKQLLKDFLIGSTARFKIVINEVPIQQLYVLPYDRWEGYGAEREEMLNYIRDNNIENVVFLTADSHANFINEVFIDNITDPDPIAYEFVTGPIATTTMQDGILDLVGQTGLDAFNDILNGLGVDCRHLDIYSYGLVAVDPLSGTLTVSLKDDSGSIILDQDDQVTPCLLTLP
jgi:phosphodiesterase/alkaline phosphatase D-like protein